MITSTARVATTVPRRYLGQLCKHFEHRLPVSFTPEQGRIEFAYGVCVLGVDTDALILSCEAADAEALTKTEDVVARHLLRFAFREPPEIVWRPALD